MESVLHCLHPSITAITTTLNLKSKTTRITVSIGMKQRRYQYTLIRSFSNFVYPSGNRIRIIILLVHIRSNFGWTSYGCPWCQVDRIHWNAGPVPFVCHHTHSYEQTGCGRTYSYSNPYGGISWFHISGAFLFVR